MLRHQLLQACRMSGWKCSRMCDEISRTVKRCSTWFYCSLLYFNFILTPSDIFLSLSLGWLLQTGPQSDTIRSRHSRSVIAFHSSESPNNSGPATIKTPIVFISVRRKLITEAAQTCWLDRKSNHCWGVISKANARLIKLEFLWLTLLRGLRSGKSFSFVDNETSCGN